MAGIILANRAGFRLASSIKATDLTFTVQPGTGSRCPVVAGGNFAYMTFKDASGNYEVMRVTGHAAGSDAFTLSSTADRGLDGTTARSWLANDAVRMGLPRIALWDIMNGATTDLGIATGTANALTASDPAGFSGYAGGNTFKIIASSTNTGAATLSIGGRTPRAIFDGPSAVLAGDLQAGYTAILYDDGTRYQLLNPAKRSPVGHSHATSDITGLSATLTSLSSGVAASAPLADPTFTGSGVMLPGNATNALHAVPLQQLNSAMAALIPAGTILPFAFGSSVPAGYIRATGGEVSRTTYSALFDALVTNSGFAAQSFSMTIASPAVFTKAGHGFLGGERINFMTTGVLPTGLSVGVSYYVLYINSSTFNISTSLNGSPVNLTAAGSGTHTYLQSYYGLGNGTTTFNVPDMRANVIRGFDYGLGIDSVRNFGVLQLDEIRLHGHPWRSGAIGISSPNGAGGFTRDANEATTYPAYTGAPSATAGQQIGGTGGSETRMRNMAFQFAIKY